MSCWHCQWPEPQLGKSQFLNPSVQFIGNVLLLAVIFSICFEISVKVDSRKLEGYTIAIINVHATGQPM